MNEKTAEMRQARREPVRRRVEFFVDADIVEARSVDRSETGIRMITEEPIQISMRMYRSEDDWTDHQASLCWAGRNDDGSMSYGLEFVEEPEW